LSSGRGRRTGRTMSATRESGSMERLIRKLNGVSAIPVTPFDEDLKIEQGTLERCLEYVADGGIEVIVPCGNTSEFYSLTVEEATLVTSTAARLLGERLCVVAGVGHDLKTAVEMSKHAESVGCDAVMVHHPPHPFVSNQGYFEYIGNIAEEVDIGVIPYLRGAGISDETVLEITVIPNVAGVKYAINDVQRFGGLVSATPPDREVAWVCGIAESWAPFFFAAGAVGFTSGLANVAPGLSLKMHEVLSGGDVQKALAIWTAVKPFEDLRAQSRSEANVSVVKEAMAQLGLCSRRVRPPISELNGMQRAQIREILEAWGLSPGSGNSAARKEARDSQITPTST
jgi:4-hydroxy-tetrahydrodipicolinate synthase